MRSSYRGLNLRGLLGMVVALSVISWLSLAPDGAATVQPNTPVWFFGERAGADAFLNVLFYVPLGLAIGMLRVRPLTGVLMGVAVTGTMETLQLAIPGRFTSYSDVLTNTAGAILGLVIVRTYGSWVNPPWRVASRLAVASAAMFMSVCLASAYLMMPDAPPGTYVGQWTPDLGQYRYPYGGRVLSATIGDVALGSSTIAESEELQEQLFGTEPLVVSARAAAPPASLSPLFRLVRRKNTTVLSIGVHGDDLVIELRLKAARWRLTRPTFYSPGLIQDVRAGSAFQVQVWKENAGLCVAVENRTDCGLATAFGSGWRLLLDPAPDSPRTIEAITFLWLFILAFPTGLWLRPTRGGALAGLLLITGGVLPSAMAGFAAPSSLDWIAIFLGVLFGVSLRKWGGRPAAPMSGSPRSPTMAQGSVP